MPALTELTAWQKRQIQTDKFYTTQHMLGSSTDEVLWNQDVFKHKQLIFLDYTLSRAPRTRGRVLGKD